MRLLQVNHDLGKRSPYCRAVAWCLAAFALLATGVVAGAMTGKEWKWVFPVAGFAAYVFAFRRGLVVANPNGLDLVWRLSSLAGPRKTRAPRPRGERAGASRTGRTAAWRVTGGPIQGEAENQG